MPALAAAPLASPTPNIGAHAQGMLLIAQGLESWKKAVAMLDPTSPLGQAVLKALKDVGKHAGSPPQETQVNSLQSQLAEAKRNAMQRLAMQGMGQSQGAPLGPGAAPAISAGSGAAPTAMAA